jgi:hypothetical protein
MPGLQPARHARCWRGPHSTNVHVTCASGSLAPLRRVSPARMARMAPLTHVVSTVLACLPLQTTQSKGRRQAFAVTQSPRQHTLRQHTPAAPAPPLARRRLCRSTARGRSSGVGTAASALAATTAAHPPLVADALFSCATAYGITLFCLMVVGLLVPQALRASAWARAVVATLWTFLPLEALYLTLLVRPKHTTWTRPTSPRLTHALFVTGAELAARQPGTHASRQLV